MADKARELTDKRLAAISKRLSREYNSARKELTDKLTNYLARADKRLEGLVAALSQAQAKGDAAAIYAAREKLEKAKLNITLNDKRYREMIDDLTDRLADVNQTALSYVNGQMPDIYRQNYNGAKDPAAEVGMSFSLMNEEAVARRVREGDIKLPKKKIDIPKDKRWNTKQLNSAVLQGIIQGESMQKIAKRILPIVDNNRDAAIRNARTMVTGAENEGRLDGFHKLEEEGAVLKKVWIATADSRTREAHLFLDGQEVGIDEPFVDADGNELMYPGDPSAEPGTVYNCRCSMRTHIVGFRKSDGRVEPVKFDHKSGMHQDAIEREREKREAEEKPKQPEFVVAQGKDISMTWERRPDDFKFEIQDVINAQEFDGKPRVVDAEEFERYVQESSFIGQRVYSAPDQQTLDDYREALYNGEWYIDCSTGGSTYGQGMYCAADYEGKITAGMRKEMSVYRDGNESRLGFERATDEQKLEYLRKWANDTYPQLSEETRNNIVSYMGLESGCVDWDTGAKAAKALGAELRNEVLATGIKQEVTTLRQGYSYIETLTLTKDAKIISQADAIKEQVEFVNNYKRTELLTRYHFSNPDEELAFKVGTKIATQDEEETYKKLTSPFAQDRSKREMMRSFISEHENEWDSVVEEVTKKYDEYRYMDTGAFAALRGYDAINADGVGESGSYTIILNRTKVIFKRDKK